MPNKRMSGAAAKKKKAAAKAASPNPAPAANFTPTGNFSFSSPPPSKRASPGPTSTMNGKGPQAAKKGFAVPSSSEEDSSDYESDDAPEADDDIPDLVADDDEPEVAREVPDDELSPEAKLERAEQRKLAGNEFYKKKDYPSATRLYTQAISLDPTNPNYLNNRAASRMESRLYSLALEDCLAASALQLRDPQTKTLLRLGKCQLALGLIVPAQQTLDQAFKLDPKSVPVQQERARAARIANHIQNVKREIENKNWSMVLLGIDAAAREVEETPREWRTWKVQALVGKKRYDEAAGMAADLLRMDQNQPEALYYRGLCLYYNGNHPQAIAHCQSALRNDPDFTLARTLLRKVKLLDSLKDAGNDAFKSNRLQEAVDKYTEGLAVDEENDVLRATLLSNRASAYLRLKKYDEALGDCNACVELQSTYFKAFRTRGRINLATEEFEAAVRDFKQAYELAPAGSADESALHKEVKDAEAKLKKSKMKDHYKTLGTHSEATEDEIKKAYRKQSLIHHPDKGGTDEKFKEIGEAYAILSDPQRRRKFDAGIDESDPMSSGGMGGDYDGFPGGHPFGGGVNLDDLFGGGGFGGGGGRRGGGHGHQHSYGF